MFFGNMQSFYRRNSIHNQSSPKSSKPQDQIKRNKRVGKHRNEDEEDDRMKNNTPVRSSLSISQNSDCEEPMNHFNRTNVPVIKIGLYEPETNKKSFNILKEKEKALWYNISPILDDNSERLGPNKNNIIEETLEIEKQKSEKWDNNIHLSSFLQKIK